MNGPTPSAPYKSKTLAAWLAVLGGALGLHRLYLHGFRNLLAWLHVPLCLAGYVGILRLQQIGQDDPTAWLLVPLFGLMVSQAMAHAIVYGLTPDERWDARHNPEHPPQATRWGPVFAVIVALLIGATVLMGTIAYGGQKFFEWQLGQPTAVSTQRP